MLSLQQFRHWQLAILWVSVVTAVLQEQDMELSRNVRIRKHRLSHFREMVRTLHQNADSYARLSNHPTWGKLSRVPHGQIDSYLSKKKVKLWWLYHGKIIRDFCLELITGSFTGLRFCLEHGSFVHLHKNWTQCSFWPIATRKALHKYLDLP